MLDANKVRDVLGNQVLEILRLQAEVETLQTANALLQSKIDALMAQRTEGSG